MDTYSNSLLAYLANEGASQSGLAAQIGETQASIARYAGGLRFPDAETARAIDAATIGRVPFAIWRGEFEKRSGLVAPTKPTPSEAA